MRKQDDLLRILQDLPKFELNEHEKNRVMHHIKKTARTPSRKQNRMPVFMTAFALFFVFAIASSFYFTERNQSWELSGTFDLVDDDGTVIYKDGVRGIEGKIGYLDNGLGEFVAEDFRKGSKMMWYVWGDPNELIGKKLTATAVHQETKEKFLLNESTLTSGMYGSDAHVLTSFQPFPMEGVWKINIDIEGKPYDSIIVNVKEPYLTGEHGTFLISEEDLVDGVDLPVIYELKVEGGIESIPVTLTKLGSNSYAKEHTFKLTTTGFAEGEAVSIYEGTLFFDEKGAWEIQTLGCSITVNVK